MAPLVINCWTANMMLEYNNITRTTSTPAGVDVRVPGFGNTSTVEYLTEKASYSYFAYVAETLVSLGYERNNNLKGAPFDFRKAPNELGEYFSSLVSMVEEMRVSTGGPVMLVAHSMGAPLMNYFLNQQTKKWRQQNIHSLVTLAGAWGGAVKAVKVYAAGDNLGSILSGLTLRTQQRTNPSLAFLLPDPELWKDEVLVVTPSRNYTIHDMKEYLSALELDAAYEMYLDTRNLLHPSSTPPGVPLHCLYGLDYPTVERIEYATGYFPDYPVLVNGPGDGTVNLRSASLCEKYASLQSEPVSATSYNKTDHMGILCNKGVLLYIAKVVTTEAARRTKHHNTSVAAASPMVTEVTNYRTEPRVASASAAVPTSEGTGMDELHGWVSSQDLPSGARWRRGAISDLRQYSDLDIDQVIASVDALKEQRQREASEDEHSVFNQLAQLQAIQQTMDSKIMEAHKLKLSIENLQRRGKSQLPSF